MAKKYEAEDKSPVFTCSLSGQEFWLVSDKGYIPVGLVMGNCVYAMGAFQGWMANIKSAFHGEVKEATNQLNEGRAIAMARMRQQADELGADGVIGVEIRIDYLHEGEWMEVIASGTAIKYVGTTDEERRSVQVVLDVGEKSGE